MAWKLDSNEGGYTAYSFDSRPTCGRQIPGRRVDNRIGAATIPGLAMRGKDDAWFDWWDYGGIVRDVWLTLAALSKLVSANSQPDQQR